MTNHDELIAALRIPMDGTLRKGAPELDEYDEQRKAAADALEAAWADATAAAYGAAANKAVMLCPVCGGTGREDDAECGDISFNTWVCRSCKGDKVLPNESILALTPQSARDWLAEREAAIRADERAKVIEEAKEVINDYPRVAPDEIEAQHYDEQIEYAVRCLDALHTDASRAISIKEKADE